MIRVMRINVARLLVPVVALWLVVMPYRDAKAVLPALVPLAISTLNAFGVITMADIAGAAASALIGGTIFALALTPSVADAPGTAVRVPTTTSPSSYSAIVPPTAPAPTAQVSGYRSPFIGSDRYIGTVGDAVAASMAYMNTKAPPVACFHDYQTGVPLEYCQFSVCGVYDDEVEYAPFSPNHSLDCAIEWRILHVEWVANGCQPGYMVSGSSCVVADVREAVSDNKVDYTRDGTSFSVMSDSTKDVDNPYLRAQVTSTDSPNDTVVYSGGGDGGAPRRISIQAASDGGSKLVVSDQVADSGGNTYVRHKVLIISYSGEVTGASQHSTAGSLSGDSSTGQYAPTAAPSGALSPSTSAGANAGASTGGQTFPSDYAHSGEALSAAGLINAQIGTLGQKIDTLQRDLMQTSPAPADPVVSGDLEGFGSTFSGLLGWSLPAHSSQCPIGSFIAPWGTEYVVNAHCQLIAGHWESLQTAMVVVWTVLALFIVLGA